MGIEIKDGKRTKDEWLKDCLIFLVNGMTWMGFIIYCEEHGLDYDEIVSPHHTEGDEEESPTFLFMLADYIARDIGTSLKDLAIEYMGEDYKPENKHD